MPDLIAQGSEPSDRWRRKLTPGATIIVGRASGAWSVPWDERISRRHLEITLIDNKLQVSVLADARNPVFYRGRKMNQFLASAGEHFVIGGTSFMLSTDQVAVSLHAPPPDGEKTFAPAELSEQPFRRADERIDALTRLPSIIHSAGNDAELFDGLVNVLLAGIPQALGVAVICLNPATDSIEVLHWDHPPSNDKPLSPSERLIRQAFDVQASVVHVWAPGSSRSANYTLESGIDWAACVPLCREGLSLWGVYLTGRFTEIIAPQADNLHDEMKFAELAAATFRNLRQVQRLTRQQGALSQFLSPPVLEYIRNEDAEKVLAPRLTNVTVLFCDLRGFSLESERLAEKLEELLERVSRSLGTMSRQILESGGVIGDFHGDAAMGFWGWPVTQKDAPLRACQAALAIRREFIHSDWNGAGQPVDFRVGIGVATGRAVAGKIGTAEQVKVTVLGPVVNVAARLEALTKSIRAPILIDGPTANVVRNSAEPPFARVRRIAQVRPSGMSAVVDLHELLPLAEDLPELPTTDPAAYELAWEAVAAGDWKLAQERLRLVSDNDRVKSFLTDILRRQQGTAPSDWQGVVDL